MTYEVTITNPTNVDETGFQKRLNMLEVRDCLLVLAPDHKCRLGLLTRPQSENTFLEDVVRGNCNVLNIDGSRISTSKKDADIAARITGGEMYSESSNKIYGKGYQRPPADISDGRFPANMILKHGNDCYCDGTKKVKGGNSNLGVVHGTGGGTTYLSKKESGKHYVDEDGKEEVPNWICEDECPVKMMDTQSFAMGIHGAGHVTKYVHDNRYQASSYDMSGAREVTRYGDSGGASRFFKQVQTEDELDAYLENLVRCGSHFNQE